LTLQTILLIAFVGVLLQILLDGPGDLKFADFGLSRMEGEDVNELFQQFSEVGMLHCTCLEMWLMIKLEEDSAGSCIQRQYLRC
jgi:hypothetical protein